MSSRLVSRRIYIVDANMFRIRRSRYDGMLFFYIGGLQKQHSVSKSGQHVSTMKAD